MNKSELLNELKAEIKKGYINFKKYDSFIAKYKTEWQKAVDLFYDNNKFSPLTENQKYFNIHCIFVEILENEA